MTLDQVRAAGAKMLAGAARASRTSAASGPRRHDASHTLVAEPWADYGLVDSGHGRKLERYGRYRFIRPEPQALWAPAAADWDADGEFIPGSDEEGGGRWQFARPVPREGWDLAWEEVRFRAQCTPFRHLAFFPDMAPQWAWMRRTAGRGQRGAEPVRLYRRRHAGDGREGRAAHPCRRLEEVGRGRRRPMPRCPGMADRPIRWLVDDAAKFAAREVRRGRRYDGIILDPPKFGRGPAGEVWRLEEGLPGLIADCRKLLDADSRFLVLTVYAVRMSALAIGELLNQALGDLGGKVECGDMAVREEARGLLCRPRSSRAGQPLSSPVHGRSGGQSRPALIAAPAANGAPATSSSETAPSNCSAPPSLPRSSIAGAEDQQRHGERQQQQAGERAAAPQAGGQRGDAEGERGEAGRADQQAELEPAQHVAAAASSAPRRGWRRASAAGRSSASGRRAWRGRRSPR